MEAYPEATHPRPHRLAALVVAQGHDQQSLVLHILRTLRFDARAARNFQGAQQVLANPPDLLVTELQLEDYNGLHLVLYAKARWPRTAALVMSAREDCVVRAEAEQIGCTLVITPTTRREWAAAIVRTVAKLRCSTRIDVIRPPFERRPRDRAFVANVMDRRRA